MAWDDAKELSSDEDHEKKETEISIREMIRGEASFEEKMAHLISEYHSVVIEFQTILTDLNVRLGQPRDKKNICLIIIGVTQTVLLLIIEMIIGMLTNEQAHTLASQSAYCPDFDFSSECKLAFEDRKNLINCATQVIDQWCILQERRDTNFLTMYLAIGAWALLMLTTIIIPYLLKNRCLSTSPFLTLLHKQDIQTRTGVFFASSTRVDKAFRVLTQELSDFEKRHEAEKISLYKKHIKSGFAFFNATQTLGIELFQNRDLRQIVYDYLNCPPEMKHIEQLPEKQVKLPGLSKR
jgi:hypothetical protein